MTTDEALSAAWTFCAPNRSETVGFPRGFWPDVARVAVEMMAQNTPHPNLDFTPTRCGRGDYPEPKASNKKLRLLSQSVDVSALKFNI